MDDIKVLQLKNGIKFIQRGDIIGIHDTDLNERVILGQGEAGPLYNFLGEIFGKPKQLDFDELGILIYRIWCHCPDYVAREIWTGKHIQNPTKARTAKVAMAIIRAREEK